MLMLQSYSQMEQRALLKVSLTILLLLFVTPKTTCIGETSKFFCAESCGADALGHAITDTIEECCAFGSSVGYYPLLIGASSVDCQPCTSFNSINPQLMTSTDPSPVVLGQNATFTCNLNISSNSGGGGQVDVDTNIQWLSANNTVLEQDSGQNVDTLDLTFDPTFEQSDIGAYTCLAEVTTAGGSMTVLSQTLLYSPPSPPPPPVTVTQNTLPIVGDQYILTTTVSSSGATISWTGSDGSALTTGGGIIVGDTSSASGMTMSTLTFTNLQSSDTGIFTASTSSGDAVVRLVADFPVPEAAISVSSMASQLGQGFQASCTGSLPRTLEQATITVSWLAPDGSLAAPAVSQAVSAGSLDATAALNIPSVEASDLGMYECEVLIESPFLDPSVVARSNVEVSVPGVTPPPVATTGTTPPSSTGTTDPTSTITGTGTTDPTSTITGTGTTDPTSTITGTGTTDPVTSGPTSTMTTSPSMTTPPPPPPPEEVDECALGTHDCSRQRVCFISFTGGFRIRCDRIARCINTDGGYECSCNDGYEGDGRSCSDINECVQETDNCHPLAQCINKVGGYECCCASGYIGDGVGCCIRRSNIKRVLKSRYSKSSKSSSSSSSSTTNTDILDNLDPECEAVLDSYYYSASRRYFSRSSRHRSRG